jgi:hypothetical protein
MSLEPGRTDAVSAPDRLGNRLAILVNDRIDGPCVVRAAAKAAKAAYEDELAATRGR